MVVFLLIHLIISLLMIGGSLVHASSGEGLGALGGGGGEAFRGSSKKGFDAVISQWMQYAAWGFLISSFLSAVIIPRIF